MDPLTFQAHRALVEAAKLGALAALAGRGDVVCACDGLTAVLKLYLADLEAGERGAVVCLGPEAREVERD